MANFFDQFDAPEGSGNFFDQFDAPSARRFASPANNDMAAGVPIASPAIDQQGETRGPQTRGERFRSDLSDLASWALDVGASGADGVREASPPCLMWPFMPSTRRRGC